MFAEKGFEISLFFLRLPYLCFQLFHGIMINVYDSEQVSSVGNQSAFGHGDISGLCSAKDGFNSNHVNTGACPNG